MDLRRVEPGGVFLLVGAEALGIPDDVLAVCGGGQYSDGCGVFQLERVGGDRK